MSTREDRLWDEHNDRILDDQEAHGITRCDTCRTSVDLQWDGELCPHSLPLCGGCECRCNP